MDKPKTTPKDFFLWAGAMVAFYWSVIAYIFLVFDYINYVFPNDLGYYPSDPYQSGISYEMASVIVLFPVYMFLMWLIRSNAARDASRNEIWVRRWLLILTIFVAGASIAVDLITLLTTFLNGEALTVAFLLKVLVIFLIAAAVLMHFGADLKGYWDAFPKRKRIVCTSVAVLALLTILAGFIIVGTPAQARLARYDSQRVNDLTNIQWQVVNYWQSKEKLPATLADLNDSISGFTAPVDPQTDAAYAYQATGELSFKFCATFNSASSENPNSRLTVQAIPIPVGAKGGLGLEQANWKHEAGDVCFERTIDSQLYPPFSKTKTQ